MPILRNFLLRHHTRSLSRAAEAREADKALDELVMLAVEDPAIKSVLRQFGAGAAELRGLYNCLVHGGADRWIYGNYVAAVSLTNPIIIYAYLRDRAAKKDDSGFCLGFADVCIRFIEGGYAESFLHGMFNVPKNFSMALR